MKEELHKTVDMIKESDSYIFVVHQKKDNASVILECNKKRAFARLIENELNNFDSGSRSLEECIEALNDKIRDIAEDWKKDNY